MANLFEYSIGLDSSAALQQAKSFANEMQNRLKNGVKLVLGVDGSEAKKELNSIVNDVKVTMQKIGNINIPTNEIAKLGTEFDKVRRTANDAIREQKTALAQLIQSGKQGSAEYNALQKALHENVLEAKKFDDALESVNKEIEKVDGSNVDINFNEKGATKLKDNLANAGKLAGGALLAGGAVAAAAGIKKAIDVGIEFQKSLADFSAITGVQGKALDDFGEIARKMSLKFGGSSLDQITTFKGILSRLGPDIAKSPEALEKMTIAVNTLSKASGLDAAQSMDAMTTAALQFGVDLNNPIKAADEMTKMINVMAAGVQVGAAEIPQISEALTESGAVAKASGVSFLELNAGIQVMAQGGKYGAEAGKALRNVMIGMQEISKEGSASLAKLGINSGDLAKALQTGGLGGALSVINKKFSESSDQIAKNQVLIDLFGKENIAAGATLISGAAQLETFKKQMEGTNTAFEQAKTNENTFAANIEKLKAQFIDFGISLFKAIEKPLAQIFDVISQLLPKLMPVITQVLDAVVPIIEVLGTSLATLLTTFSEIIGEIFAQLIPPLVKILDPIMKIADVLLQALMPVLDALLPVIGLILGSLGELLTSLVPLINLALQFANFALKPLLLMLQGVGYAVYGVVEAINWMVKAISTVVKWVGDMYNGLKKLLGLNPEEKHEKHAKSLNKVSESQKKTTDNANALANANLLATNKIDKNTDSLNKNTTAGDNNAKSKKSLLEQLQELALKIGVEKALESKIGVNYLVEYTESEQQKGSNAKLDAAIKEKYNAQNFKKNLVKIESQFSKDEFKIKLPEAKLELPEIDIEGIKEMLEKEEKQILIDLQKQTNDTAEALAVKLQPIAFDKESISQIDKETAELKKSYNKREIDYKEYVEKLNELEDRRAEAVVTTGDLIGNVANNIANAYSEMALASAKNLTQLIKDSQDMTKTVEERAKASENVGKALTDFAAQTSIALGAMVASAITETEGGWKNLIKGVLGLAEQLLGLLAPMIIAQFSAWIPIPFVGTAAGVAAVASIYALLELGKSAIGAEDGVIGINTNYNKKAGATDTINLKVAKGESIITRRGTQMYEKELAIINRGGDLRSFMLKNEKLERPQSNGMSDQQVERIIWQLKENNNNDKNRKIDVYNNISVDVNDSRRIQVKKTPLYR